MRQKRVTLFEVDDFENLKNVVEKKYALVKNAIFLLKDADSEIENFLKSKNISYFVQKKAIASFSEVNNVQKKEIEIIEKVVEIPKKTKVFKKVIRAGEEIESDDNMVFLERINPGAVVKSSGNIEIFADNLGRVECDGEYVIIKKGKVVFHKEEIEVNRLSFISKEGIKVLE